MVEKKELKSNNWLGTTNIQIYKSEEMFMNRID